MSADIFTDTDIFLHHLDASDARKHKIAERVAFYDSLIVAAALGAGCKQLYSDDRQHGQRIGSALTITNPFAP